ncbi:MAG: M4 family metallopeptidase [Eubacteriales bacterium]|nr:M4 family metallopeptidase [Eubacteriales bacterium]
MISKNKNIRIITMAFLFMAVLIALGISACSQQYLTFELKPNEYLMGEGSIGAPAGDDSNEVISENFNNSKQLDENDIQEMNDGKAMLVYSKEGYLTFLKGRYYDEKIEDYEDAVKSLNGVASLIGLKAGSEFFCVFGEKDDDGYTYYVFQQRYGNVTVRHATLRVVIGPDGYTAGLSNSFTPDLGIAEEAPAITARDAENIVKTLLSGYDITYYGEHTSQVAVSIHDVTYHAFVVYTSNPSASASTFDMMYYEHFVSYDGRYLYGLPVATLTTDRKDVNKASEYFKNLEQKTYTGTVTLHDGTEKNLTVPVAYSRSDDIYYLADTARMIIVADYYGMFFADRFDFITSKDNTGWDHNHLITYHQYINAYDFYNDMGIKSVDGFGTPIMVCVDYCDKNRVPVDNACYTGMHYGWACFGASKANNYGECLDVVCHEYTHAVTTSSMCGMIYSNETGAINEAYSDIVGNICEMYMGSTSDLSWLVAENSGKAMRSMSNPNSYGQPEYIGDRFYVPAAAVPDAEYNDNGGVHYNNSLLSQVACKLHEAGMSLEEQRSTWVTSISLITPRSGYDELYVALVMSIETNGLDSKYKSIIKEAFEAARLLGDRGLAASAGTRPGCGRISFKVSREIAEKLNLMIAYNASTGESVGTTWADPDGNVSMLIPTGNVIAAFAYGTAETDLVWLFYSPDGVWQASNENTMYISVSEGSVSALSPIG